MGDNQFYSISDFIRDHQSQLEASSVPPELWGSLYKKITTEEFDAGGCFRIICEEELNGRKWNVQSLRELHPMDENCVFLIDHAWTFRPFQARRQLEQLPQLLTRLKSILELEGNCDNSSGNEYEVTTGYDELTKFEKGYVETKGCGVEDFHRHGSEDARLCAAIKDENIDNVLAKIWKYANTYTIRCKETIDEEGMPLWYIMDEFGSRIGHSITPNARVVPFFFLPRGIAYSILFLLKPVAAEEEITRNYIDNAICLKHPEWQALFLLPWNPELNVNVNSERTQFNDQFYTTGRIQDDLPIEEEQAACKSHKQNGRVLQIFADDTQLVKHINSITYELVEDWHSADIIWFMKHFHDYRKLCQENPRALINQFPCEGCLTVKDLLSAVVTDSSTTKEWHQETFNLSYELPAFVAYFKDRESRSQDNTWIVKPWNLARSMDMHVSDSLGHIIRLMESGPKIVCKYINRPLLFHRLDNGNLVKFDLRFIVFVLGFRPLKAFVYNDFWIRFAINNFTLAHLDDIETHFTVFNYADSSKILQMRCEDFVKQIERTYPWIEWTSTRERINSAIKDMLEVASKHDPPRGIASNAQSRAMYGVDVMLQFEEKSSNHIRPTILECNFMPDCERACQFDPDFADTVFNTLFMDVFDTEKLTKL